MITQKGKPPLPYLYGALYDLIHNRLYSVISSISQEDLDVTRLRLPRESAEDTSLNDVTADATIIVQKSSPKNHIGHEWAYHLTT